MWGRLTVTARLGAFSKLALRAGSHHHHHHHQLPLLNIKAALRRGAPATCSTLARGDSESVLSLLCCRSSSSSSSSCSRRCCYHSSSLVPGAAAKERAVFSHGGANIHSYYDSDCPGGLGLGGGRRGGGGRGGGGIISDSSRRSMATSRTSPFLDPEVVKFIENFQTLMLKEALQEGTDRKNKVLEFQQPEDLTNLLDLEIRKEPESRDRMLEHCSRVVRYSAKTGHPRFFNQLYSGLEVYSLAGSWLTDSLNTNIHTYECAPVFVVMEKYVMGKLCETVGFPRGQGEGIFCPGGSFSNIMAVHLARYRNNPDVSSKGLWDMPKVRLYTSEGGHYSLKKSSMFLGIGTDHVIGIPTDDGGRLRPEALDSQMAKDKAEGYTPLIVMATSGTTVLGAYDPLNAVADVCKKHGVWMHVDCAWGGGVLFSDKYRHLMAGVERADSVAWNLHKMCHVTIQASALMVRENGLLQKANGVSAEYLFQPEKPYDTSYDIGDRSVQCGRRVDALKVWMTMKGLGDRGMCDYVERAFDNAQHLTKELSSREGFRLVLPEFECTNVSFWYIPPCLRGQEETPDWWRKVGKVAPIVKKGMMMEGSMMIAYQPLTCKNLVNFFRVIVINSLSDFSDMEFIVDEIERLGKGITLEELA
ncbi:cysteine sulfinic acid decarboxylase-like [Babylonia areolata]|uniref:cysteine sulfinic acid decarboxylase-like n=1 Tax=Babylonia areolata TaxID=304850 RepID=UPI003FCFB2B9